MLVYIVILAMVAVFLALRLYAVLGKRTGHEQVLPKPAEDAPPRRDDAAHGRRRRPKRANRRPQRDRGAGANRACAR